MKFILGQAAALAACLALSSPAVANSSDIPQHAERFVRALQQQRFDEAAAMFKPGEKPVPAATAEQLKRISARIGGFGTMRNVLSLPSGTTLKLELSSSTTPAPRPASYHQLTYTATARDGQPVYYIVSLDGATAPQRVLWFEVHVPTPDAAATRRAEQALRDIL